MDAAKPKKLLEQVQDALRVRHCACSIKEPFIQWIRRYILFNDKRHPKGMTEPAVEAFLTHIVVDETVAASTQNQALSALLFLDRCVFLASILIRISRCSPVKTIKSFT
jgi:Phage integrase, N-terminal SAM-like domain